MITQSEDKTFDNPRYPKFILAQQGQQVHTLPLQAPTQSMQPSLRYKFIFIRDAGLTDHGIRSMNQSHLLELPLGAWSVLISVLFSGDPTAAS